jgi:hypothetical protein
VFLQTDPLTSVILHENFLILGLYVVGGVFLLISLLGLLSVTVRNCFIVILYLTALIVMIIVEAYLIAYVFTERSNFDSYVLWKQLPWTRMEQLQRAFDCCGFNASIPKFPNSSCASEAFCHEKIHATYTRYLDISAIVEVIFLGLQVLTLLAMSFLAGRPIRHTDQKIRVSEDGAYGDRNRHRVEETRVRR